MKPKRILIANRGEIAVRLMRAVRELGHHSIFFFPSGIDVRLECSFADESYLLDSSTVYAPFLDEKTIIAHALLHGVDAIHPGYGFLSESSSFARACGEAGILFIGPDPATLALTGDKKASKDLALSLAIPTLPSSLPVVSESELRTLLASEALSFPIVLKASSGGGGRGIHVVHDSASAIARFPQIQQQVQAYFGSSAIFIEHYCAQARHVEVQVAGDGKGTYVVFPERDCTLQRRHQKIIEETPSSFISEETRKALAEASLKVAEQLTLLGLATVEFLVTPEQKFYFLEVNPRIQVEHGITELLTGIDLAMLQMKLLLHGDEFLLKTLEIRAQGWAMEARVTAENPQDNFAPSAGVISHYRRPSGPGVRVDDALYQGCEIPPYFDPLLAKVIVCADSRPAAISKLLFAMEEMQVGGVETNISLVQGLLKSDGFLAGEHSTAFVEEFLALQPSLVLVSRFQHLLEHSYKSGVHDEGMIAQVVAELYHKMNKGGELGVAIDYELSF